MFFSIGCSDDESVIDDPFSEYPDLILGHWGYISDVLTITKTYDNSDLNEETVKEYALEHGPAYAHPRRVFFVQALPLSGTNKIDRRMLEAKAVELAREEEG